MKELLKPANMQELKRKRVVRVVDRCYYPVGVVGEIITILPYRQFSHISRVYYFSDGTCVESESIMKLGVCWHEPRRGRGFEAYEKQLTSHEMQRLYHFTLGIEGEYDRQGIVAFVLRWIKQNPFKWFCAELHAYADYKMGRPVSRKDPYMETPQSFRDSLAIGVRSVEDEEGWF